MCSELDHHRLIDRPFRSDVIGEETDDCDYWYNA